MHQSAQEKKLRLLWLGLSFPPAAGGASRYAQLMAAAIDTECLAEKAFFLVGKHPNEPDKVVFKNEISVVERIFTYRAGRPSKSLLSYFLYFVDNIKLMGLGTIIQRRSIDALIVHGWYMLRPSILWILLPILKRSGIKLVADIRDCYLGEQRLHRLDVFDKIICCGRNVEKLVCRRRQLSEKAVYVPVPLSDAFRERPSNTDALIEFDLSPGSYIFSPAGIDDAKRFRLLYDAWIELLSRGSQLDLVIAGRPRDWRPDYGARTTSTSGRLILTGDVSQDALTSLYAFSAIAVNVSNNESFGRVPIEALDLRIPMILPCGVPEFSEVSLYCISKDDPVSVAEQISHVISADIRVENYDLSIHDANRTCKKTIDHISKCFRN